MNFYESGSGGKVKMAEFVAFGFQFGFYGFHALACFNGGGAGHGAPNHVFGNGLGGLAWAFDFHAKRPVDSDSRDR